jgi:hypothetical protein
MRYGWGNQNHAQQEAKMSTERNKAVAREFIKWTGMTFYRIVNGKVAQERGEEDIYGFLRQIGAVS